MGVGVNAEDAESRRAFAGGLIIRNLPSLASNWRCEQRCRTTLQANNVVAIAEIDTRKLTRILRERCTAGLYHLRRQYRSARPWKWPELLADGRQGSGQSGRTDQAYTGPPRVRKLASAGTEQTEAKYNVVAFDYGVKHNILRMLAEAGEG